MQRPETQWTLSIVLPFTSHFDSPQTASQGCGSLPAAGIALQVQQSAKILQSLSFSHSGVADSSVADSSGAGLDDSDFVVTAVASVLEPAFAAGSPAGAFAGDSDDFPDPPQPASNKTAITRPIRRKQFMRVQ